MVSIQNSLEILYRSIRCQTTFRLRFWHYWLLWLARFYACFSTSKYCLMVLRKFDVSILSKVRYIQLLSVFPTASLIWLITHRHPMRIRSSLLLTILLNSNLADNLLYWSLLFSQVTLLLINSCVIDRWFAHRNLIAFVLKCLWWMRIQVFQFVAARWKISTLDWAKRMLFVGILERPILISRL